MNLTLSRGHHFDQAHHVGVVFHMLSAVPTHGFVGLTAIDRTAADAQRRYDEAVSFLTEEAAKLRPGTRPVHG